MSLYNEEKLWLVLDLDNTLLHTGEMADLSADDHSAMEKLAARGRCITLPDVFQFEETPELITKLRPFVNDFLQEASEIFHLCVCTMGSREYAEMMVSLLDPEGLLFGDRVICREDFVECDGEKQKRLDSLPCGSPLSSKLLILDDLPHVWHHEYAANIIAIDRYIFFPSYDSNEEPLLRSTWMDESFLRGPLAYVLTLLKDIHNAFSCDSCSDARELLQTSVSENHRIWKGFKLPSSSNSSMTESSAAAADEAQEACQVQPCVQSSMGASQCLPCC